MKSDLVPSQTILPINYKSTSFPLSEHFQPTIADTDLHPRINQFKKNATRKSARIEAEEKFQSGIGEVVGAPAPPAVGDGGAGRPEEVPNGPRCLHTARPIKGPCNYYDVGSDDGICNIHKRPT